MLRMPGKRSPIDPRDWPFEPFTPAALKGSISDRFEAVARRFPERLAVSDAHHSMTYGETAALVDDIAAAIIDAAGERQGPVAILMASEARYPAAILGTLAAARGCIPLDLDHPPERNRLIAGHAAAIAVLSAGAAAVAARSVFTEILPVIDIGTIVRGRGSRRDRRPGPADVAWIIYTSGSTGTPKGVFQNHRNFLHDLSQATSTLQISAEDRLIVLSSPSLIAGLRNILSGLVNGASLHILPPHVLQPAGLVREMRARRITILRCVPTLFRLIVEALGPDDRLDSVRLVYLSGERVEWDDWDRLRRAFPQAIMVASIGSTEASTSYCQWSIDASLRQAGGPLPIGRPLPDRSLNLVDESGQEVADGESGEFMVTSRYIALGYWNEPALTSRAFTADPEDPEARTFRTGDLGRRRPDGLFEFLGRKDQQVKLGGRRIELGEIESALQHCSGVRDAAIVVRKTSDGLPRALVAYCELEPGISGLLPRHLRSMLIRVLPHYMLPSRLFIVGELPRLSNMKIDRIRLAEIDACPPVQSADRSDDPLVDEIAALFEAVIGVAGATPEDNVASLGGDSLQAVNLAAELARRFSIDMPADIFAEAESIGELARWIAARRSPVAAVGEA